MDQIGQTLEAVWKAYQAGEYDASMRASLEIVTAVAGIDLIHIAGLSLMQMRRIEEGLALLKAAVTLRPQSAHIYSNAAFVAEQVGMVDEVAFFTERGLHDFPDDADLLLLKANNFVMQMRFEEAADIYHSLLARNPNHVQALVNLGNVCRAKDQFAEAEQFFEQAAAIEPDFRDLVFARASMCTQLGQNADAMRHLEAIGNDIDAQFLLSLLYLAEGDYDRGWRLYRARGNSIWYRLGHFVYSLNPFDHWSEAAGKNIAVVQEGGLGDLIQFVRYLPMLADVADKVVLFTQPSMLRLLRPYLPANVLIETKASYQRADEFDYVTTEVEMPYHFRTTLDTIPNTIPYLTVSPEAMEKQRLPATKRKRVGLCWAGGPRDHINQRSYDERRSIKLAMLAPLAEIPGIEFVSLQYGPRGNDLGMHLTRAIDASFDLLDTAALIAQLDLVITVDTAVVHLAAAMGKPTWLLSRFDGCWRWLRNRPENPWYPGVLRVFGQKAYRDWSDPLQQIRSELEAWASV